MTLAGFSEFFFCARRGGQLPQRLRILRLAKAAAEAVLRQRERQRKAHWDAVQHSATLRKSELGQISRYASGVE